MAAANMLITKAKVGAHEGAISTEALGLRKRSPNSKNCAATKNLALSTICFFPLFCSKSLARPDHCDALGNDPSLRLL
jgi:hypothetical protein